LEHVQLSNHVGVSTSGLSLGGLPRLNPIPEDSSDLQVVQLFLLIWRSLLLVFDLGTLWTLLDRVLAYRFLVFPRYSL
jgi:hypothetical protein